MCPTPKIRVRIGDLPLISIERGTRAAPSQINGFLLPLFDARDLTTNVEALTCCERGCLTLQRALTNPSFGPWKNETGYRCPKLPVE
jgi:hypothetical protein